MIPIFGDKKRQCRAIFIFRLYLFSNSSGAVEENVVAPIFYEEIGVGLPDHLKIFQGHFFVLWLLKFYFMPILIT